MGLIQAELDMIAQQWNAHNIRIQKNADIPCGRPDIMYFIHEINGGHNFGHRVEEDVQICQELYGSPKQLYSNETEDLVQVLSLDNRVPLTADESLTLYLEMLQTIEEHL